MSLKGEMKVDVLIIGGGPIGIISANFLANNGKSVAILLPNEKIQFHSSPNSLFKLDPHSNSGLLYGNTAWWGNQHDVETETDWDTPEFQNMSGWPFPAHKLRQYQDELIKMGWPVCNAVLKPYSGFSDFSQKTLYRFKKSKRFIKLNKRVHVLSFDPTKLGFKFNGNLVCHVQIAEKLIEIDYLVLASGGISNVYLVSLIVKELGIELKFLGKGYSNHPKRAVASIRFHKLFRFKRRQLNGAHIFGSYALEGNSIRRNPRVSFRLWPTSNSNSLPGNIVATLLEWTGFARNFDIIFYYEVPPVSNNSIEVTNFRKNRCFVHIKSTNLPREYFENIQEQESSILDKLSRFGSVRRYSIGKFSYQDLLKDSNHHFGGTRMGINSETSVVNDSCRLHQAENIYVFGTSVLPVSSSEHPTYLASLVALKGCEDLLRNAEK